MFKQVWNKLFQTASPCEPFVAGALRFIISHVDAQFAERLHQLLRAHLFVRAAAEEEIMTFLLNLPASETHRRARFHVSPENRPAEPANVGEHVETRQRCLERLVSSPRQACHCTVFAVGLGAECTVYHRNEVFQNDIIERSAVSARSSFTSFPGRGTKGVSTSPLSITTSMGTHLPVAIRLSMM